MSPQEVLNKYNKVTIVGLSPKPDRDSYAVANYLKSQNFQLNAVRPAQSEINGIKCYPSIKEVEGEIEILDVFRASEHIPQIVDEAIVKGIKVLWLQLGVQHPDAEKKALDHGIIVISNKCIKIEDKKR